MRKEESHPYGLVPSVLEADHYLLGASPLRGDQVRPDGDWRGFLPDGEPQNVRGIETYNCTGYGTNNVLEMLLRAKGVSANNSDRALGIAAGTSPVKGGNDPHVVAETIRKGFGCVDEAVLPFDGSVLSVTDYYRPNPLPGAIVRQGASWWERWALGHEWLIPPNSGLSVAKKQELLLEGLKYSPLGVSVYAWVKDGARYVKPKGVTDNHWVALVHGDKGKAWYVFDSYDGYIKKLDWGYDFGYCKVYYLQPVEPRPTLRSLLAAALSRLVGLLTAQKEAMIGAQPSDARLLEWAEAIKAHEGWFLPGTNGYPQGSRSYRNRNPGNMRYSPFETGKDGGFSVFPNEQRGMEALVYQLRLATSGRSKVYSPDMTLLGFFSKWAPSADANDPEAYAEAVAKRLGVTPMTRIKDL